MRAKDRWLGFVCGLIVRCAEARAHKERMAQSCSRGGDEDETR